MEMNRNALVVGALSLARYHSRRVRGRKVYDSDDAHQDGAIGLIEAATRFDAGRGVRFSTFAHRRVAGRIQDAFRAQVGKRRGGERPARPKTFSADKPFFDLMTPRREPPPAADDLDSVDFVASLLPPREAGIFRAYFGRSETMAAIGHRIGASESYISYLISRCCRWLRSNSRVRRAFEGWSQ